jgi:hypothetical protein
MNLLCFQIIPSPKIPSQDTRVSAGMQLAIPDLRCLYSAERGTPHTFSVDRVRNVEHLTVLVFLQYVIRNMSRF